MEAPRLTVMQKRTPNIQTILDTSNWPHFQNDSVIDLNFSKRGLTSHSIPRPDTNAGLHRGVCKAGDRTERLSPHHHTNQHLTGSRLMEERELDSTHHLTRSHFSHYTAMGMFALCIWSYLKQSQTV